jgi:DNA-binding CsgD family transcriptional regulator
VDEKETRERLAQLDEAGRIRIFARLMTVSLEQANLARKSALSAQKAAILAKKATTAAALASRTAVEVAKWALKQGQMNQQTASRVTEEDVQVVKDALQKAEAAMKAANHAARDQQRIEENLRPLTPREKQVYLLLARGKKDREIAKALKIAERTVRMHVGNIKLRLDITDRDDFVMLSALLS